MLITNTLMLLLRATSFRLYRDLEASKYFYVYELFIAFDHNAYETLGYALYQKSHVSLIHELTQRIIWIYLDLRFESTYGSFHVRNPITSDTF